MPPGSVHKAREYDSQPRQVLPAIPTSIVCNLHEYCLYSSRAVQVFLASHTSVEQEPYKCGSSSVQEKKKEAEYFAFYIYFSKFRAENAIALFFVNFMPATWSWKMESLYDKLYP